MFWYYALLIVVYGIWGAVWGWAVNKVVENKGYHENWFWWGFFFGLLALIVALTKPDMPRTTDSENYTFGYGDNANVLGKDYVFTGFGHEREKTKPVPKESWSCVHCGKVNAGYVGTCACGWDKSGNAPGSQKAEQPVQASSESRPVHALQDENGQPQMLYCTSCGKRMAEGAKFCGYCGAEVKS